MSRTRSRPFVTGTLGGGTGWYLLVAGLLVLAVTTAGLATNWLAAACVFLGAFTYGVVYTLWLKRRTWLNIVIGGLAGSFAVLAGAAAIDPTPGPAAWTFAVVLFLWTPPHFWSLATYYRQDYADAGVPMLPVVHGERVAAVAILGHTVPLVLLSLLPLAWGAGWLYAACAAGGGGYFIWRAYLLVREQTPANAIRSFLASLLQLGLLLAGAIVEGAARGSLVHL
jgi:protoheme IX farnesyltransferase